jgi:hypothetical protein
MFQEHLDQLIKDAKLSQDIVKAADAAVASVVG